MKKKPSIVVFEVNDNNRSKIEYGKHTGKDYFILFCEFIASLGYDVESDLLLGEIKINGHKFKVDTNNASYMSKNAFNRTISIRKPQNRYILIVKGHNKYLQSKQDTKTRESVLIHFKSGDDISVSLIQRKCNVGYNSAHRTLMNLVMDGIIKRKTKGGDNTFKFI